MSIDAFKNWALEQLQVALDRLKDRPEDREDIACWLDEKLALNAPGADSDEEEDDVFDFLEWISEEFEELADLEG